MFMLGCTFIEVLTGCSREPYDWLTGEQLLLFRSDSLTRDVTPLLVRRRGLACFSCTLASGWLCRRHWVCFFLAFPSGCGSSRQALRVGGGRRQR